MLVQVNLGSHKGSPGHLLSRRKAVFSPQRFADLNPIEQVFAKLKHLLPKAAARNLEASSSRPANSSAPTPCECANYFANAGYRQT